MQQKRLPPRGKLSAKQTDAGQACQCSPLSGSHGKSAPHPALRATFPQKGKANIIFHSPTVPPAAQPRRRVPRLRGLREALSLRRPGDREYAPGGRGVRRIKTMVRRARGGRLRAHFLARPIADGSPGPLPGRQDSTRNGKTFAKIHTFGEDLVREQITQKMKNALDESNNIA